MPLFIYTDSIEKNVDEIRKYTNRKIIAVMKSNAYELGSKKIIPILRKKGVDFFAFEKCKEYFENIEVCKNTNVLIMESIPTNKILKINNKNVRISINSCLVIKFLCVIFLFCMLFIKLSFLHMSQTNLLLSNIFGYASNI